MCIHLKFHQPYSLKRYSVHQIDADHYYFDDEQTKKDVNEFADRKLLPLNDLLLRQSVTRSKLSLSITGVTIQLLKQHRIDAIESLSALIRKLNANIIQRAYYNSVSEHFSLTEYKDQLQKNSLLIQEVFDKVPIQNLCYGSYTCSKHLLIECASFKIESDLQHLVQLIEHPKEVPNSKAVELNTWNKGYDKRLLQKLYGLEKMVKFVNDETTLGDWRKLQDTAYYNAGVNEQRLTDIKNILSDFEIVLIKKYLTKTKRKERDIPVIL